MFRSPYISLGQSLIFSQYKEFEALLIEIHGRRYGGRRLASNKANHFSDDKKTYRSNWLRTASYVKQFLVHWSIDFIGYFHFDAVTSIWEKNPIYEPSVCCKQFLRKSPTLASDKQQSMRFKRAQQWLDLILIRLLLREKNSQKKKPLGANLHFQ